MTIPTTSPPADQTATAAWNQPGFLLAAATQQADNHLRRAYEVLRSRTHRCDAVLEEAIVSIRASRQLLRERLSSIGVPEIHLSIGFRTDVEGRFRLDLNAGLALCALGASKLEDFSRLSSLSELRIGDLAAILRIAQRLGWDREIDALISDMHPGSELAANPLQITERINREPWKLLDYPQGQRESLRQCMLFCAQLESQAPSRPGLAMRGVLQAAARIDDGERSSSAAQPSLTPRSGTR